MKSSLVNDLDLPANSLTKSSKAAVKPQGLIPKKPALKKYVNMKANGLPRQKKM